MFLATRPRIVLPRDALGGPSHRITCGQPSPDSPNLSTLGEILLLALKLANQLVMISSQGLRMGWDVETLILLLRASVL